MILTHLAFARNIISMFYNVLKCLQILRRFSMKRERILNFTPVVSNTLITKANLTTYLLFPKFKKEASFILKQRFNYVAERRQKIHKQADI